MSSLSGKRILITRASHQASELTDLVRQHGAIPVLFPTIEIVPPSSWEEVDRMIGALYMYDGLIFTSSNGVDNFMKRFGERGGNISLLSTKLMYVVGEKTARAVEAHGLSVTLMPERFTSSDLAKILDHKDLTGMSFLFPRGNLGANVLQDNLRLLAANVDSCIVYETRKPKEEHLQPVREALLGGNIDIITFTSPSTFHNFTLCFSKDEVKRIFEKCFIAVIGPVTAKAVVDEGYEPDVVSKNSTIESLIESIAEISFTSSKNPTERGFTAENTGNR